MLLAIREDEEKARGLGIRVTGAKLVAWSLSVAAHRDGRRRLGVLPDLHLPESAVDPLVMIGAVLMTFLGGRGTLWGPAIGAFVLVPAQQYMLTEARREPALPRRLRGRLHGRAARSCRAGSCRRCADALDALRERQRTHREPVVDEEAHA